MISRNLGFKMSNKGIKKLQPEDIDGLFVCLKLVYRVNNSLTAIIFFKEDKFGHHRHFGGSSPLMGDP